MYGEQNQHDDSLATLIGKNPSSGTVTRQQKASAVVFFARLWQMYSRIDRILWNRVAVC